MSTFRSQEGCPVFCAAGWFSGDLRRWPRIGECAPLVVPCLPPWHRCPPPHWEIGDAAEVGYTGLKQSYYTVSQCRRLAKGDPQMLGLRGGLIPLVGGGKSQG